MLLVLASVLGGLIMGVALSTYLWGRRSVGTLVFHQENPDEQPVMAAVLDEPVAEIRNLSYVVFKVSQK